jgi:hypothetical protein
MAGGLIGCRRLLSGESAATATSAVSPATLSPRSWFVLQNDAVSYSADQESCGRTTIQGMALDADGAGLAGVTIRWWADDPGAAQVILTDALGSYRVVVDSALSDATYHLQIVEPATGSLLSDVIVAQAIPSCDLNVMAVNFVSE